MDCKKKREKIPQQSKIRAELQKEIGSQCPLCDSEDVGHFQIHHIDENPANSDFANLLLLCPTCHSKITKKEIKQADVYVAKVKLALNAGLKKSSTPSLIAEFNAPINNAVVGNNNNITIKKATQKIVNTYPEGCIGSETNLANYISHLIGRYNEYKEYEVGKGNVKYALFQAQLKKHFGIGPTRKLNHLPIERFEELTLYIQSKIDGTMLGRMNKKKQKNYSTFEEYMTKK